MDTPKTWAGWETEVLLGKRYSAGIIRSILVGQRWKFAKSVNLCTSQQPGQGVRTSDYGHPSNVGRGVADR